MRLIKQRFDESYHENPLYREMENSQRNRARLGLIREDTASGKLLEIGCGKGGFLRLAEAHFDVEGVDISDYAIESSRSHFGSRVRVANIVEDDLPTECYDVIAVFNILEHLPAPGPVIGKLAAALKPGGLLVGSVPNNYSLVGGVVTRIGNYFDRTHVATYTPGKWRGLFQAGGFQHIRFLGEVTIGRNRCRYLKGPLWPHLSFNLMFLCKR